MPFKNVEYLDDLFTWAEAEGLLDESADDQDEAEPTPGTPTWTTKR